MVTYNLQFYLIAIFVDLSIELIVAVLFLAPRSRVIGKSMIVV